MIRVLICDDQWIVCEGLEAILDADSELEVVGTAHDGREALEAIPRVAPDIVLMDLKMPGMNGITLGEKVKSLVDTPFILFTGRGSEEVAERAFEVGIDDYIRKEATLSNFSVLSKRVLTVIGRHKAERLLHLKEEELSWLVDNSIDAIFRIEFSKGITRYNPAFLRLFSLSLTVWKPKVSPFTQSWPTQRLPSTIRSSRICWSRCGKSGFPATE